MKNHLLILLLTLSTITFSQVSKKEQDKSAIRKMEGCYKVTFAFSETFSPVEGYEYHDKKFDEGIEYVKIIEDSENIISLQHLLIVHDTMVIKHWRQDWIYQNENLLVYDVDNNWKNIKIDADKVKGTWTQKVFQVDDSPRYEGYGTWNHVDDRHFWESFADAPLPRREHTKRDDYNVTSRFSHIEIFNDGWVLEQDNDKIIREETGDKVLCSEKGIERFYSGEYNCEAAINYWNKTSKYWEVVRKVWTEKLKTGSIHLELIASGNVIYMRLFELAENYGDQTEFDHKKAKQEVEKIIGEHITVSK